MMCTPRGNAQPQEHATAGLRRRRLVGGAVLAALPGVAWPAVPFADPPPLARVRTEPDRLIEVAVCTRPFRAQGPRIEPERIAGKTVIHNYGHGGSGWSLSWGAAQHAVELVRATGERRSVAVIGCGAIGLTSAIVAQRAGLRVRIYSRDRPPDVASVAATGVWSPASRICTDEHATPAFRQQWELMARRSFHVFQSLLGLPGVPVEWCDGYALSDIPFDQTVSDGHGDSEPLYPRLEPMISDIRPRARRADAAGLPFAAPHAVRYTQMVFNLAAYSRLLVDDFIREGGEIVQREFASPRQFAGLKERTVIHATGYGARALLGDHSITPVRGQTARLMPQPEVHYGLTYRGHNVMMVPRRDGLLVQAQAEGDFGNADTTPDRAASLAALARLAVLFNR